MDELEILKELCAEYQKLLRIQDWEITLHLVDIIALPNDKQVGHTSFSSDSKAATIKLLREKEFFPVEGIDRYDMEFFLVHELLHIQFHSVHKEDCSEYEAAIDLTAKALVKLRREVSTCRRKLNA